MDAEQAKWAKVEPFPAQSRPTTASETEKLASRHDDADGRLAPAAGMILGLLLGALFWGCLITAFIVLR
jgi:hypothetical protein